MAFVAGRFLRRERQSALAVRDFAPNVRSRRVDFRRLEAGLDEQNCRSVFRKGRETALVSSLYEELRLRLRSNQRAEGNGSARSRRRRRVRAGSRRVERGFRRRLFAFSNEKRI